MLTTTTNYAIRALAYIASLDGRRYVDSFEISRGVGIPRNFLLKILRRLRGQGIVRAHRGIGGGFRLAKPAKLVALHDVVEVFEDMEALVSCAMGIDHCPASDPCPIHEEWTEIRQHFISFPKNTTFESFRGQRIKDRFPQPEPERSG